MSKKRKTRHVALDGLSWQPVVRTHAAGLDFDEGLLELEEVVGVQVEYHQTANGRVATFTVDDSKDIPTAVEKQARPQTTIASGEVTQTAFAERRTITAFDSNNLLPEWHSFSLHPQLYAALYSQKFVNPTPIQSLTIPKALGGCDVIGVAETGSGKTLAYGLPILHELLTSATSSPPPPKSRRPLRALILAPTRELALQVSAHLNTCLNHHDATTTADGEPQKQKRKTTSDRGREGGPSVPRSPPLVSVAAIVGGMSTQKQRRILERGVDVLVATPGRLWDILEEDDELAEDVKNLRYLVLDEADRMIEAGHFAQLDSILRLTRRQFNEVVTDPEFRSEHQPAPSNDASPWPAMQTFVFSATLSKELQQNLKKRWQPRGVKKNNGPASTLDDLLLRLDFRDSEPEIINISPEGGVVSTLKENRIECLATDKDVHLYHFLLRYPGRTLVFLSSIDGIRRLTPLLELLGLPTFPLHSQLEQRQRLKNLDCFKSQAHSILLATDIAARGLDIPSVSHVVHYQIPRTVDAYIHRNGRTARAQRRGFSLLICAPDERRVARALFGSLGRQVTDVEEMNVEHHLLDKLKRRLRVAKEIDAVQHRANKAIHEKKWMRVTADALDVELDSDYLSDNGADRSSRVRDSRLVRLRADLKELLSQPLVARGVSTRYITYGSRPVAPAILAGEYQEGMIGVEKTDASANAVPLKEKVVTNAVEFEEWTGIQHCTMSA
ncbi:ATP-dependent RNA helicase [Lactarius akahatsu]|uniref:RNA helicase n=1 Tax=Lactarius akahatsu TaxID=416441 RepID=A0AAD4QAM9_9AGAM|nr:ATP-dependent RNA helicase [Lactarius akahatsu]